METGSKPSSSTRRLRWPLAVTVLFLIAPTCSAAEDAPSEAGGIGIDRAGLPVPFDEVEKVQAGVFRDGRVFLAGQPDEQALRSFSDLGVTAVVNLRTPSEMDDRQRVPFDEAAVVAELGMDYVHIPLGGEDHPYSPEAVDRFAAVLAEHTGPVLLHCTVAWRASYLWAAYLIMHENLPLSDALARGEAVAISPPPLQGLLGRPLTLEFDGEAAAP